MTRTNYQKKVVKKATRKNSNAEKNLHEHEVNFRNIEPMSENQALAMQLYNNGKHLVLTGSAGTGKTMLSLSLALEDVLNTKAYKKIFIVRSAVPTRNSGFVPGKIEEKDSLYEPAYFQNVNILCGRGDAYDILKKKKILHFCTTSYLRGITINDAIVIVDEVQNLTIEEISTVVTRLGKNSRLIISGDLQQSDLSVGNKRKEVSGFIEMIDTVKHMKEFGTVWFTVDDIVRSGLVKSWIKAREKLAVEKSKLEKQIPPPPPQYVPTRSEY